MSGTPDIHPDIIAIIDRVVAAHPDQTCNFSAIMDVHPSVLAAYKAAVDVRVHDGTTRTERVGKVALARGPQPQFLLVEPAWKGGVYRLGHNHVVVATRTGPKNVKGGWVNIARVEDHNGSQITK